MASEYTSWQSVPNGRGTWSILSSCVITLVLCVYTAVHLNVPAALDTRARRWLCVARWVLMGTFAPELVVWTAWCQWAEAKQISKEMEGMKQSLADPEKSPGGSGHDLSAIAPLINSWTLKHSYFVIMGGIQLRPADAVHFPGLDRKRYHKVIPYHYLPQSVLTTDGFLALLRDGHGTKIPVLTEGDIDDRSKADGLAKVLSCLQGSWILVQIIGRVASHLTITELEINTLAHVLCTIAMYMFWWNKPLNVQQPIFLDNKGIEQWTRIRSGLRGEHRNWIGTHFRANDMNASRDIRPGASRAIHVHTKNQIHMECEKCPRVQRHGLFLCRDVSVSADEAVEVLQRVPGNPICDFVAPVDDRDAKLHGFSHTTARFDCKGYWLYVRQSELDFLLGMQVDSPEIWDSYLPLQWYSRWEFTVYSSMLKEPYFDRLDSLAVTVLFSSLYGALHASLWQHHFPTTIEMWMWRISCVIVSGTGLILAAYGVWLYSVEQQNGINLRPLKMYNVISTVSRYIWDRLHVRLQDFIGKGVAAGLSIVISAAVFCRFFLFIEAFISLRSQPMSVYETPNWTQWLPHL